MNKQMTDLEEMKKAIEVKEEEASSVLEQDKNKKQEDEDVEKNQGMRSLDTKIAKNMINKISDEIKFLVECFQLNVLV